MPSFLCISFVQTFFSWEFRRSKLFLGYFVAPKVFRMAVLCVCGGDSKLTQN